MAYRVQGIFSIQQAVHAPPIKYETLPPVTPVPLKKSVSCPASYIDDNGEQVIIWVSHPSDGKILKYIPSKKSYQSILKYPKLKCKEPSIAINQQTKQLYIYDFQKPLFCILSLTAKKTAPDLITNDKKYNIPQTGPKSSTLYIPKYNEYHIIGGTKNNKHYIWNDQIRRFQVYSATGRFVQPSFVFIESKNCFLVFGKEMQNMWALEHNPNQHPTERNWFKIGSPFPKLNGYGCCVYKGRYVLVFGGNDKYNGIMICDAQQKFAWNQSERVSLPQEGFYHAVNMNAKNDGTIHIFKRYMNGKHWKINANEIVYEEDEKELVNVTLNSMKEGSESQTVNDGNDVSLKLDLLLGLVKEMKNEMKEIKNEMKEMKNDIAAIKQKIDI